MKPTASVLRKAPPSRWSKWKSVLLPDEPKVMRIVRGPFRGARVVLRPQASLRKIFGLYEHELNGWIVTALQRIDHIIDVGANDGYFSFGCAAAFHRSGRIARVIAFEPQLQHVEELRRSSELLSAEAANDIELQVDPRFVGASIAENQTTLDALVDGGQSVPQRALVKIDVEGAELGVIDGAAQWMNSSNLFLIEVHHPSYFQDLVSRFAARGLTLDRINQRPLPIIGRESRHPDNGWLVSRL